MIYDRNKVEILRQRYPEGTRICLDSMENDPRPIPSGAMGTVKAVDDAGNILMKWAPSLGQAASAAPLQIDCVLVLNYIIPKI